MSDTPATIRQRIKHTAKRIRHVKKLLPALVALQKRRRQQLAKLIRPHKPPTRTNPPLDIFGVDYAWGKVPYDALKKAGVKYALRYISHDTGKDLSLAEKRALHARGIKVGLVFETTAKRALAGKDAGAWDARFSRDRCKSLGLADIPVFFAVDWDATDADKPHIAEYLRGAVSVLGRERVGVYGSFYVVGYMASHDVCDYLWQTYAWSGGFEHDQAHVLQYSNSHVIGGLSCDYNHARSLAWAR
jgi:hypothetical protein